MLIATAFENHENHGWLSRVTSEPRNMVGHGGGKHSKVYLISIRVSD